MSFSGFYGALGSSGSRRLNNFALKNFFLSSIHNPVAPGSSGIKCVFFYPHYLYNSGPGSGSGSLLEEYCVMDASFFVFDNHHLLLSV
jgi:hypothetical protein